MEFESKITGYISVTINSVLNRDELLKSLQSRLNQLPKLSEDIWPFLPREIFSIAITESDSNSIPI